MIPASEVDRRKEIVRRFEREVWSDGDVARRNTIHHDPGDPWEGRTLDPEGFKDRVRRSRASFPDQRFAIDALIGESETVLARWLWTRTHRGDIPGIPASGRSLSMSGVTVYHFDGDRLSGHWQVVDRSGAYQQLSR